MLNNMSSQEGSATGRKTLISCLEAPRLKELATEKPTNFKKHTGLYGKQIEKKSAHFKKVFFATSLEAAIENDDHETIIAVVRQKRHQSTRLSKQKFSRT